MFNYEQTPKTKEYRNNYDKIFGKPEDASRANSPEKADTKKAKEKGGKK